MESACHARSRLTLPGDAGFINYLPRTNAEPLDLLQGDTDTFGDIVGLIGEYEGMPARIVPRTGSVAPYNHEGVY